MKHTRRFAGRAAAVAAIAAAAAIWAGAAHAYTIITRDGHRIEAQSPPEVRGLHAYLRLAPRGQLAMIQEERIDWARTEAANGKPALVAVPADAVRAEGASKAREAGAPIEKKIVGKPAGSSESDQPADAAAAQATPTAAPPAQAPGAPAPGSQQAEEAIAKLRAEHAQLAGLRNNALEQRTQHAAELETLQSRQAGYAAADSTTERKIRELKDRIAEADAQIGKLESRMAAIGSEVIQLGGSLP